jgi:hypothetical protein
MWQPWASLVAIGAKRIETRPKPAPSTIVGQRIAIHACKTEGSLWQVARSPVADHLIAGVEDGRLAEVDGRLPLGYLLATVVVRSCQPITRELAEQLRAEQPDEFAFGDYRYPSGYGGSTRFAYFLEALERLPEPVPFTGSQGIFHVPNELVGAAPEPTAVVPAELQGSLL